MEGYVYVLSNKALKKDLYKIGITYKTPEIRAKELSRSTSIPDAFNVYYYKKTNNLEIAEKRIHLLLDEYRYNINKEFFQIEKDLIEIIVNEVVYDIYDDFKPAKILALSQELIESVYTTRLSSNERKLVNTIMSHTKYSSFLEHIILSNYSEDIFDGFLSYTYLMNSLHISKQQAMRIMRDFTKKHKSLKIKFLSDNSKINIFKDLRYYRGEMSWIFTDQYKKTFILTTKF